MAAIGTEEALYALQFAQASGLLSGSGGGNKSTNEDKGGSGSCCMTFVIIFVVVIFVLFFCCCCICLLAFIAEICNCDLTGPCSDFWNSLFGTIENDIENWTGDVTGWIGAATNWISNLW